MSDGKFRADSLAIAVFLEAQDPMLAEKDSATGLSIFGPVDEESSATYKATVVDSSGVALSVIDSITLDLFDRKTGVHLNSRKDQDVLDVNGGSFDTSGTGLFTMIFSPDDNKIIEQRRFFERHTAIFTFVYASGALTGRYVFFINVRNVSKVGEA